MVGMAVRDLVDHSGLQLLYSVSRGDDVVDRAVLIGLIDVFKPVREVAEREGGDVFLGRAGVQVARKDRELLLGKDLLDVGELIFASLAAGPFQVSLSLFW